MNENLYLDELKNALRISEFEKFHGETTFSNVAAKFVASGQETYIVNGKKFLVNEGEYILGNNNQLSEVSITQKTKGLCVDISNDIITEIVNNKFENRDLSEFLISDKFLINKYHSQNTNLGHSISLLSHSLFDDNKEDILTTELFYSIGESIVNDQGVIFEQYSRLRYKKQVVNEDVFRNLHLAKQYIDDCFRSKLSILELAKIATSSKYAFIRLFKSTFGVTPYHYIQQKRLQFSKQLILQGEKSTIVAQKAGFADVQSFSKAFKNYFGVSPSNIKK